MAGKFVTEQEILEANKLEKQCKDLISDYTGNIAKIRDLRNKLSVIKASIAKLERVSQDDKVKQERKKLEKQQKDLQSSIVSLEKESTDLSNRSPAIIKPLRIVRKNIEQKQKQLLKIEEEITRSRSTIYRLEKEISNLVSDPSNDEAKKTLKKRIEQRNNLRAELEKQLSDFENSKKLVSKHLADFAIAKVPEVQVNLLDSFYPILFFPVRLETRFLKIDDQDQLCIRIYPDDMAVETHEELLTEEEFDAGCQFSRHLWYAGSDLSNEKAKQRIKTAWNQLASLYEPWRAAWIYRELKEFELEGTHYKFCITNWGEEPSAFVEYDDDGNPVVHKDPSGNVLDNSDKFPVFLDKSKIDFRSDSWTKALRSRIMPDFFIIRLYRNDSLVFEKSGNPIPYPLFMSPPPQTIEEQDLFYDEDSRWIIDFDDAIEKGMAVTITQQEFQVKNPNQKIADGFTRIIAIGLKTTSFDHNKEIIEQLIENHHYTEGFSFLSQGTPTNKTKETKERVSKLLEYENSYEIETGNPLIAEGDSDKDGNRVARALGIDGKIFERVEGANGEENKNAQAMNRTLWPVTWEYFLEYMMAKDPNEYWGVGTADGENINPDIIASAKRHFIEFTRGRGPFPAIKVGETPYGILPVSSLKSWVVSPLDSFWLEQMEFTIPSIMSTSAVSTSSSPPVGDVPSSSPPIAMAPLSPTPAENDLAFNSLLHKIAVLLADLWKKIAGNPDLVPRAGGTEDSIADLFEMQKMIASSKKVLIRPIVNVIYLWNIFLFWSMFGGWGVDWSGGGIFQQRIFDILSALFIDQDESEDPDESIDSSNAAQQWIQSWWDEFEEINKEYREYIKKLHQNDSEIPDVNPLLLNTVAWGEGTVPEQPFIQESPITDDKPLENNYIESLIQNKGNIDKIKSNDGSDHPSNSVLYNLLRLAVIRHHSRDTADDYNTWIDEALEPLKTLPTGELERLLGETLDLASHRLDAWITSMVTKRLHNMRETTHYMNKVNPEVSKEGIYIGAYGWVEDLTKKSNLSSEGGYIFAPSDSHAKTAAILRNGYISHRMANSTNHHDLMAVKLTSDRVRRALWLIEGINEGQHLGALLGYQFERALHENYLGDLELDIYIYAFRKKYPLHVQEDQSQNSADDGGSVTGSDADEAVAANNVVNGLDLLRAWNAYKNNEVDPIPFGSKIDVNGREVKLPSQNAWSSSERKKFKVIARELDCLDDALDAVGDLGLAESFFQIVRGNYERAGALLDSLSGKGRPPDPDIAKTPRGGLMFKHRFIILFSKNQDPETLTNWYSDTVMPPRSEIEPLLNGWLDKILIDPSNIKCRACFTNQNGNDENHWITLHELAAGKAITSGGPPKGAQNIGPLDFLAMAASPVIGEATELEQRLTYFVRNVFDLPLDTSVRIEFDIDPNTPDWNPGVERSFREILPFTKYLFDVISSSRILSPSDLYVPEEAETEETQPDDHVNFAESSYQELKQRVDDSKFHFDTKMSSLETLINDFETNIDQIRQILLDISLFGIQGSIPRSYLENDEQAIQNLRDQVGSVYQEMTNRKKNYEDNELKINELLDPVTGDLKDPVQASQAIQLLINGAKSLFGKSFVVLPRFDPGPNRSKLEASFDPLLLDDNSDFPVEWFQKAAQTHSRLNIFENVTILGEALNLDLKIDLKIGQLPYPTVPLVDIAEKASEIGNNAIIDIINSTDTDSVKRQKIKAEAERLSLDEIIDLLDRWFALPLRSGNDAFEEKRHGTVSLVVYPASDYDSNLIWKPGGDDFGGLVLDDWDELIPRNIETAAIAYHYDRPNSEAPQSLLLFVPPEIPENMIKTGTGIWNWQHVVQAVEETLDLAKIRSVDLAALKHLGRFLPALYISTKP
ncbi:MAG: hypothetical protein ACFFD4_18750 [Candidatus Odinarchaeota archaeon]